jgi:hypothetical protein
MLPWRRAEDSWAVPHQLILRSVAFQCYTTMVGRNAIAMNNFKLWLGTMPYLYALHWHVSIYCNDQ